MRKREAPIKSGEASSFPLRFGRKGTAPFDRLRACPREGGGRTEVDDSRPFVHSSKIKGDRSNRPPLCHAAPVGESRSPHGAASTLPLQIGRAHVCTPVTNAQPVCRLLL